MNFDMDNRLRASATGIALTVGVCVSLLGMNAALAAGYDFESLLPNHTLSGQDNWVSEPFLGEAVVRVDDTAENGSQVTQPLAGVSSGWTANLTRVSDPVFGYSPLFGDETEVVVEFDTNAEAATGFALGHDVDGDGLLTWQNGEVGPSFGTLRDSQQGSEQFAVSTAAQQAVYVAELNGGGRCCNDDDDWYRLQLRMDLSANDGAGSGSLYYRNLSRGDTSFQAVAELQGLNLGLYALHPDAGPETWNAIWLTMLFDGSRSMPSVDNLVPRLPAVLESDSTLSLQAVDAQQVFGASYDVELKPFSVASDPYAQYWRVSRAAVAVNGATPGGTLTPDLNLVLERVDVQAVFPDLGALDSACLRYQGLRGTPSQMTWKYDPMGCN